MTGAADPSRAASPPPQDQGPDWHVDRDDADPLVAITVRVHARAKDVIVSLPGDDANPRVALPARDVALRMNPPTYRLTLPLSLALKHGLAATEDPEEPEGPRREKPEPKGT